MSGSTAGSDMTLEPPGLCRPIRYPYFISTCSMTSLSSGVETAGFGHPDSVLDTRASWSRPVCEPDQSPTPITSTNPLRRTGLPVQLLESFLALGTSIARGVDGGGERIPHRA